MSTTEIKQEPVVVCTQCGGPNYTKILCCESCSKWHSEYSRNRRRERKEKGICTECGIEPVTVPGRTACNECSSKKAMKRRELKEEVFKRYSGESVRCACCGEAEPTVLCLDHKFNDGHTYRKEQNI